MGATVSILPGDQTFNYFDKTILDLLIFCQSGPIFGKSQMVLWGVQAPSWENDIVSKGGEERDFVCLQTFIVKIRIPI